MPPLPGPGISGIISKARSFGSFAVKGTLRKVLVVALIVGGAYFIVLR